MTRWDLTKGASLAISMCEEALKATYGRKFRKWLQLSINCFDPGDIICWADMSELVAFDEGGRVAIVLRKTNRRVFRLSGWTNMKGENDIMEVYCIVDQDVKDNLLPVEVAVFNRPFDYYNYSVRWPFGHALRIKRYDRNRRRMQWLMRVAQS